MHGILFSRKLCGPWKCIERAECRVDRMINWSIIITHFSRTPTSWQTERTRYRTFNYVFSLVENEVAKKNPEFLSFRKKKRKRKEGAKKKKKKKQKKEFLSERLPKDRGADRGLGLLLLLLLSGIVFFFFLERKRYPRSGGRVDNIGKWSGRYGGRKAWNKKRKKEKKITCAEWRRGRVSPCKFSWCPPRGGLWGHDGGAVPGPCNLKSSQGGSRGCGGGNNPGTPHGRSASPPYSSATMQQTHEKFTLQSAAKKSNVLREACALLPTMEPAIASLLTGETICADC